MTELEHRERHKMLHRNMDELVADYLMVACPQPSVRGPATITLMELMVWSHRQTEHPVPLSANVTGEPHSTVPLVETTWPQREHPACDPMCGVCQMIFRQYEDIVRVNIQTRLYRLARDIESDLGTRMAPPLKIECEDMILELASELFRDHASKGTDLAVENTEKEG
jgi:hypothetical protein